MDPISRQLPTDVYRRELETIIERRKNAQLPVPEEKPGEAGPTTKHGLVGMALSGGGIRSATLGLGVVEALAESRVLERVDYVSTVSGGGYTGSMLSSLLNVPREQVNPFPLAKQVGQEERPALRHLRDGSNYLSPGGLLDKLRLPLQLVRSFILSTLLFLPRLMLAVVATELIYEASYQFFPEFPVPLPFLAAVPLVVLVVCSPIFARYLPDRLGWEGRNRYELVTAAAFGAMLVTLLLIPLNYLVSWAIETPWSGDYGLREHLISKLSFIRERVASVGWAAVNGLVVFTAVLMKAAQNLNKRLGRLAIYFLGALGPALLLGTYLLLCVVHINSPFIPKHFETDLDQTAAAFSLGQPFQPSNDFKRILEKKGIQNIACALKCQDSKKDQYWLLDPTRSCDQMRNLPQAQACTFGEGMLAILSREKDLEIEGSQVHLWDSNDEVDFLGDVTFFGVGLALVLFTFLFIDVNLTSLHGFYRDRLSKLFLFRLTPDQKVESTDDLKLSALNAPGSIAPYHLLNVTLNLQGASDPELHGRAADFFFFSKHFCGGPRTGYCETTQIERADPHINLGTAMAISAAAANPNMGAMQLQSLTLLMTLLNVRLGYWAPNPSLVLRRGKNRQRRMLGPGPSYLFREGLGALSASLPYVNVSDGGHLENLGVYELLRRRCAVIIAVDGEADASMSFPSLLTLMRYAWIDLGVELQLDLDKLRLEPNGRVQSSHVLGKIRYGNGEEGLFVYLKSSLTGDESLTIADYRTQNPAFPHESTADQFFNEYQFESYRALGNHIGRKLLADPAFTLAEAPASKSTEPKQVAA